MIRFLIIVCFFSVSCSRTQGFSLKKITSRTPTKIESVGPELETIQSIFSQPLYYVGSGNHTYAFATFDQSHIVKFFKQNHFNSYCWLDYLPLPDKLNPKRRQRRQKKANSRCDTFQSLEIAFNHLKEQTGLVYMHLNRSDNIQRKVKLIYSDDRQPVCNIDDMEFIIQKRATVGFEYVDNLLKAGDKNQAVGSLIAYLKLIRTRCEKGLGDQDLQFYKNFGFIDGRPVEIDIGDFFILPNMQDPQQWVQEVKNASYELIAYIERTCPDLLDTFQSRLEELLQ